MWTNPPVVLAYVLLVEVAAVAAVVVAVRAGAVPSARDALTLALLAGGAAVHGEITRRVEQAREIAADGGGYADPYAVWTFAGVCLLPPWPALLLVGFVYAYSRRRVNARPPLHRTVFTSATVIIAVSVAGLVLTPRPARELLEGRFDPVGLALTAATALTYIAVNLLLVAGVVSLAAPTTTWRERLGRPADHAYELAALAFAVAVAVLAQVSVWLLPALLVPLFTAHRSMLFTRLVQAVRTDDKTGLATSAYWYAESERVLDRALRRRTPTSVLMIDLDHFKIVNDTYGHLAGDGVLRAVADLVHSWVGVDDLVGRFGGEEYVVLLHDAAPARAAAVAHRIRVAVAALEVAATSCAGPVRVAGITVSIGVATIDATGPGRPGNTLDGLLLAADTALYRAKRDGRNRVHHA